MQKFLYQKQTTKMLQKKQPATKSAAATKTPPAISKNTTTASAGKVEEEMKLLTRKMETIKIRSGFERLFRILGLDIKLERNIFKAIKQFNPDTFKANGIRNILRMIFEFYDTVST